jgi:hypothetical protein
LVVISFAGPRRGKAAQRDGTTPQHTCRNAVRYSQEEPLRLAISHKELEGDSFFSFAFRFTSAGPLSADMSTTSSSDSQAVMPHAVLCVFPARVVLSILEHIGRLILGGTLPHGACHAGGGDISSGSTWSVTMRPVQLNLAFSDGCLNIQGCPFCLVPSSASREQPCPFRRYRSGRIVKSNVVKKAPHPSARIAVLMGTHVSNLGRPLNES